MSVHMGFGFKDVADPEEAGYARPVSQKYKKNWIRNHTCQKCGGRIRRVTRSDGKVIALDPKVSDGGPGDPSRFWLYRYRGNGTYGQQGSGPGYPEHVCPEGSQ